MCQNWGSVLISTSLFANLLTAVDPWVTAGARSRRCLNCKVTSLTKSRPSTISDRLRQSQAFHHPWVCAAYCVFVPLSPYSPDDFKPRPSISSVYVQRDPLYKLLVFAEIKAFGEVGGAVWDFFYKDDFRTQFGIAAFEIRLINYPSDATRTASSVKTVATDHICEGKDNLELIVVNQRLDSEDNRRLGLSLIDIATELEKRRAPPHFLGVNFVQIRRSKRLSGNLFTHTLLDYGCLEELQEICAARAHGQVKNRLAQMVNVWTACNGTDDLTRKLCDVMELIETRHHRFREFQF